MTALVREVGAIERDMIRSPDGTMLVSLRLGSGAPLVICHGSFSTAEDWLPFAREMAATHSVILYDRRGRGESRPAMADFAIDAEVGDLAAVVAGAGPGAAVLGHSFGGSCALAFAARKAFDGPLIVYEPRHSIDLPMSRDRISEIERLIATGDLDAALHFVMTHVIGLPEPAITAFRASPQWSPMLATLPALPRELRFLDTLVWRRGDLDAIGGSPWLLVGADSPDSREGSLLAVLPRLRRLAIAGQKHFAHVAAPAQFAEIVRDCLATA